MSTKHSKAAARFIGNRKQEAWHDETLWMVRVKREIGRASCRERV